MNFSISFFDSKKSAPNFTGRLPKGVFYDMPTLFSELLKHDFPIHPFPIREYWLDIGRMDEYRRANDEYEGVFGL